MTGITAFTRTGKNGPPLFGPGALFLVPFLFLLSCGGGGSSPPPPPLSSNQLLVSLLPGSLNTPVVSLTVCVPGTTTCQTIDNILLDTGSVGLRLAHGAVSIPLPQVTDNGYVYECMQFGTFDNFGPVVTADVALGSEPTLHSLTVQVSNSTLLSTPSGCGPLAPFSQSGINGILGVGYPFSQYDGQRYYTCPSTSGCSSSSYSELSCRNSPGTFPCQVSNPVFSLPTDNNGVLVSFPSIPSSGYGNRYGTLTFGLGTQSDNSLSGLTSYTVGTGANSCSSSYYISATFTGSSGTSCAFLDTGSNGLFFGTTTFPLCPSSGSNQGQWYCPSSSPASIFFSPAGANGSTGQFTLSVLSFASIANSQNIAWNDLAGPYGSNSTFDAGLPFFFGRTVAIGFQTGGQTPFWAF